MFWGGLFGEGGVKTPGTTQSSSNPPNPTPLRDGTPEVVQALCPPPSPKKTPSPSPPPLSTVVIWGGGAKLGLIQGMVGRGGEKKKKPKPQNLPNTKNLPKHQNLPCSIELPVVGGDGSAPWGPHVATPSHPQLVPCPLPGLAAGAESVAGVGMRGPRGVGGVVVEVGSGTRPHLPPHCCPPVPPLRAPWGGGSERGGGGLGEEAGGGSHAVCPPAPCQLRTPPCRRGRSRPAWPRCCCCPAR